MSRHTQRKHVSRQLGHKVLILGECHKSLDNLHLIFRVVIWYKKKYIWFSFIFCPIKMHPSSPIQTRKVLTNCN